MRHDVLPEGTESIRAPMQGLIVSYEVKKGDTYKSLAQQSPLYSDAESRLRLLNGDYPTGNLETGTLIKVVK